MTRDKFQEIYDCVVKPTAIKLINERNEEIKTVSGGKATEQFVFNDNFGGLYEQYLLKKNSFKAIIKDSQSRKEQLLDRHKISAALVIAIVDTHLISDNRSDERDDGDNRYDIHTTHRLNEAMAFWCGVSILMMYMTTKCEHYSYSEGALQKIKNELDHSGMIFPPSVNEARYKDSAARGLFYSGSFYGENPILLSNSFFWMEQYFYKHIGVEVIMQAEENCGDVKP